MEANSLQMKTIKATRKVREELERHFRNRGSVSNLPVHLAGVDPAVIVEASCRAEQHRNKRRQKTNA